MKYVPMKPVKAGRKDLGVAGMLAGLGVADRQEGVDRVKSIGGYGDLVAWIVSDVLSPNLYGVFDQVYLMLIDA